MILLPFNTLPSLAVLVGLSLHFAAGLLLGLFYFRSLWWIARLITFGRHVKISIALTLARFTILGGLLTLASLEGAPSLLMMALGTVTARPLVMRSVRGATV